jgi:hypothetical protein
MNGFDSLDTQDKTSDMTRFYLHREVSRGRRLRAEQLAAWGRKVALTWASLFRRPGRLLPTQDASRNRFPDAASVYAEAKRA